MSCCSHSLSKREVRALRWVEGGEESTHWWTSESSDVVGRRAIVIWLRDLGKIAWWIGEGDVTLALGFIDSLHEPEDQRVAAAKRSAAQRWWELLA